MSGPSWVAPGRGSVNQSAESNRNELIILSFVLEDVVAFPSVHVLLETSKKQILLDEFFEYWI